MRSPRWNSAIFLMASGLASVESASVGPADAGDLQQQIVQNEPQQASSVEEPRPGKKSHAATGAVEANAGQRVSWRFNFHFDAATQEPVDFLALQADDAGEQAPPDATAQKGHRTIELRTDVRLKLQGGSMRAEANRAVVDVKYQDASETTVDSLTIKLHGNVHWNSDGIDASADTLTLSFRPSTRKEAAVRRSTDWTLRGRAQLKGQNFVAHADHVEVVSRYEKGEKKESEMLVTLKGEATLKWSESSGGSDVQAARMEMRPQQGVLPSISDLMKPQADRKQKVSR